MTPTPPKKQAKKDTDAGARDVIFHGEGPRVLEDRYYFTPGEKTLVPRALAEKLAAEDPDLYEVA